MPDLSARGMRETSAPTLERALLDIFRLLAAGHPSYTGSSLPDATALAERVLPQKLVHGHVSDAVTIVGELWNVGAAPFSPPGSAISAREFKLFEAMVALQGSNVGLAVETLVELAEDGRVIGSLFALRTMMNRLATSGIGISPPGRRRFRVIEGGAPAKHPLMRQRSSQAELRAV